MLLFIPFLTVKADNIKVDDVINYMNDNNIFTEKDYFPLFGRVLNGNNENDINKIEYKVAKEDDMIVYGMTESGKQVVLYTWSGNMSSDLHVSNLTTFNKQTEKIRQIRFYTYSPHDDCAKDATISYSVNYKFDISLLESNYKTV